MKDSVEKMSKWKVVGVGLMGIILFSASMSIMFDFKETEIAQAEPNDLIMVKNGLFSFLDIRGYNFEFQCEINQVLINETEQYISEKQFVMISDNSFGRTTFIFDYLPNGDVKFTIDHKGNMRRDNWFRITVKDIGLWLLPDKSSFAWDSGHFDYSDMEALDNFRLDESDSKYWLSVYFYDSNDFFIDPLLSRELLVGDVSVSSYDKLNISDSSFFTSTNDAVGIWDFESRGGVGANYINDSSGNGYDGLIDVGNDSFDITDSTTPTTYSDYVGYVSTGSRINYGDSDNFTFGDGVTDDPFSVAFWYRLTSVDYDSGVIFGKSGSTSGVSEWLCYLDTGGNLQLYFYDAGNSNYFWGYATISPAINTWYHVIMVYDGSGVKEGVNFYINGEYLDGSGWTNPSYVAMNNTDTIVTSLRRSSGHDLLRYVYLDELSLWNKMLSASEAEYIYSRSVTYSLSDVENNVEGENYGYLTNGSEQVQYQINYTILPDAELEQLSVGVLDRYHQFVIPKNYTFVNVTLPNNTVKTLPVGFTIDSYNSSHYLVNVTDIFDNGTFTWFFITDNAIVYLDVNPRYPVNDTLTNQSDILYYVRVTDNESVGLVNYPVTIQVKHSDETILYELDTQTGANGWFNSSIDSQLAMYSDYKYWLCVTGTNGSYLGYAVDYWQSYNDWNEPIIYQFDYDNSIVENNPFTIHVYVNDDYTLSSDLIVYFYYSTISSGSLNDYYSMEHVSGDKFTLDIAGKEAETTLWFQISVWDNLSNLVQTSIYQVDWTVPLAGDDSGSDSGGDSGGTLATTTSSSDNSFIIFLVFLAGGIMVAVLGYAVFKRTTVRTRSVETKEVVTGFGGFGSTKEIKEEKG